MKIKPGDLFEWVYKYNNSPVVKDEELFPGVNVNLIPCFGLCLCVGFKGDVIYWVSNKGLFYSSASKSSAISSGYLGYLVIPRKVEQ